MHLPGSRANLAREHLGGQILVTGNTVIDALQQTVQRLDADPALRAQADEPFHMLDPGRRLLLVTGHRRESFGQGFEDICRALAELAQRPDLQVLYPVHLNPNVQAPVNAHLGNLDNVHLVPPQDYLRFVRLMQRADVILTDSGGVQEEAPALAKPVLVMRDVTERPEAVEAGVVTLVGTTPSRIVEGSMRPWHSHRSRPVSTPMAVPMATAAPAPASSPPCVAPRFPNSRPVSAAAVPPTTPP